jgi:hypothetical protein
MYLSLMNHDDVSRKFHPKNSIVSDAYKNVFDHYSEMVQTQMEQKDDLENKIKAITEERITLLKDIETVSLILANEVSNIPNRDLEIDKSAARIGFL